MRTIDFYERDNTDMVMPSRDPCQLYLRIREFVHTFWGRVHSQTGEGINSCREKIGTHPAAVRNRDASCKEHTATRVDP